MAKLLVINNESLHEPINSLGDIVDVRDNDKVTTTEVDEFDIVFIGGMTMVNINNYMDEARTKTDFDMEAVLPKYAFTTDSEAGTAVVGVSGVYIKPEFVEEI